jgi:hypothetical protein
MINLLQETRAAIKEANKHPRDIIFIGSQHSGHNCTWQEYIELADLEYDGSYGHHEVALDLIIVFSDSSLLERNEYDGAEWWSLVKPFTTPPVSYTIRSLFRSDYSQDYLCTINTTQDAEATDET